jgi:deoxyribonuclease-4
VFREFDDIIGAARLKAFHLNDSQKLLGSRVDRHALIGQGEIGAELFRYLVNEPRFKEMPGVLETPIAKGQTYRDQVDLLKSLAE